MLKLGQMARDKVTGFEGTVTARCENLNGEPRIAIENLGADGCPREIWVYEARAHRVDAEQARPVGDPDPAMPKGTPLGPAAPTGVPGHAGAGS